MTSCPRGPRCRCEQHYDGLAAYAKDRAAYDQALAAAVPKLTVVTMPPTDEPACTGQMTCPCSTCARERVTPRPKAARQPWDPRPARRAA
jgi:hypothetical protein